VLKTQICVTRPQCVNINKRRERMYWGRSDKISKLEKKISTRVTASTAHHDSNNPFLQPENLYTV